MGLISLYRMFLVNCLLILLCVAPMSRTMAFNWALPDESTDLANATLFIVRDHLTRYAKTIVILENSRNAAQSKVHKSIFDFLLTGLEARSAVQRYVGNMEDQLWSYYIFIIDSAEAFRAIYWKFPINYHERRLHFLVVLTKYNPNYQVALEKIFKLCFNFNVVNVNIIFDHPNHGVWMYTYEPFSEVSCGVVKPVLYFRFRENWDRLKIIFPPKLGNLHGCPLRVSGRIIPPMLTFEGNERNPKPDGAWYNLSGIEGVLLKIIARALNFTIDLLPFPQERSYVVNDTAYGCLALLFDGKADLALGGFSGSYPNRRRISSTRQYYQSPIVYIIRDGHGISSMRRLMRPFNQGLWIFLGIFLLLSLIIIETIKHVMPTLYKLIFGTSNRATFLNFFGTFLGYPVTRMPVANFARYLLILWLYGTLILRNAYQGSLYDAIRTNKFTNTPQGYDNLIKWNYHFLMSPELMQLGIFPANRTSAVISGDYEARFKLIEGSDAKYATATLRDNYLTYMNTARRFGSDLCMIDDVIYLYQVVMFFPKHSIYLETFNRRIQQITSSGIIDLIYSRISRPSSLFKDNWKKLPILNDRLKALYQIYGCMMVIAVMVFVLELISVRRPRIKEILEWLNYLIALCTSLVMFEYDTEKLSIKFLWYYQLSYVVILVLSICIELAICIISTRGSILDSGARSTINIWIYIKSFVILFDITWLVLGLIWIKEYYFEAPMEAAKKIFLALVICNWTLVLITLITIWCTFDTAGRSWVKMKKYQRSMRETESRFNYKRSGSMNRNWRQRKVFRAYQDSWDHRCRLLFCCMGSSERNQNSFTDIARLLSDFFRELDVVPSDVVAGLVLLRKFQRLEREAIVRQRKNGTYEFLSGVPITEQTQFLALNDTKNYDFFQTVIHYMYFAQGAYGWPMYFIIHRTGLWHLLPEMRCLGCCCGHNDEVEIIQDNCWYCNYAALKKTLQVGDIEIIYVTYHVDVGETPFFVAVDYTQKKVVISIRGTLSMKDILTDLNAEGEVLPLNPPRDDWLGHKGMVQAAIYIKNKLEQENLIQKALTHNPARNTQTFGLVLVGHSLGAGTAAILAILLKPDYPTLQCFSYSPPGGLLSMPAVEYTKSFITSVVLGKDVVPRIGLHQMEALRADLINAIQRSVDPKWKTISCSVICCGCGPEPTSVVEMSGKDTHINQYQEQRGTARTTSAHPADSSIALTLHQPLYPPGRIIHIVRHHPKPDEQVLKNREPVYQAIWADSTDFDEVLISPVMLQDHMPDQVLAALKKVVTTSGPRKPQRQTSNAFSTLSNDLAMDHPISTNGMANNRAQSPISNITNSVSTPNTTHKICLETSFTNLQSPIDIHPSLPLSCGPGSSKTSSIAGSLFGRSQVSSSMQQYDISSMLDESQATNATIATNGRSPSVPSEATTVIMTDCPPPDCPTLHKPKAVAFDMALNYNVITKSPSPQMPPRSILHRQQSARAGKKPTSLPLAPLRRASDCPKALDLIHDDWFGLAPLASPETLSEISSISSRTSAAMSLANSIERYLQNMTINENGNQDLMNGIYESQLHTPKILRRAPKFTENLSTCAEDTRYVDQYKRMGQVFVTFPRVIPPRQSSRDDSSDESFESAATSHSKTLPNKKRKNSSKSADQIDDDEDPTGTQKLGKKLTFSDSQILDRECTSSCPNCPCRSGTLQYCCQRVDHSQCLMLTSPNLGSLDTYFSANSSLDQFSTPHSFIRLQTSQTQPTLQSQASPSNGHITVSVDQCRPGVLESHFPVYESNVLDTTSDEVSLLSSSSPVPQVTSNNYMHSQVQKRSSLLRKRNSTEERIFSRNESLPLLANLSERTSSASPSPSFVKRKSSVYPANSNKISGSSNGSPGSVNAFVSTSSKNESSV